MSTKLSASLSRNRSRRNTGFTLLELIVVVVVLGVLALVAVPSFTGVITGSTESAVEASSDAIARDAKALAAFNTGANTNVVSNGNVDDAVAEANLLSGDGWDVDTSASNGATISLTKNGKVCESVLTVASGLVSASAPSCSASGGGGGGAVYAVGDVGPGGGIVFYVHSSGTFASTGSDCGSNCRYLEAAPDNWNGGGADPSRQWSGNNNILVGGTSTGLGTGYANTSAAVAQNATADRAITLAWDYSNNSKEDWHLPSQVELNELCKYARTQTTGDTSVVCNNSGSLRSGFAAPFYWSSSEVATTLAWGQVFSNGFQGNDSKPANRRVRPVRAF